MTYLSAAQIHDGKQWLPAGTVVEVDDHGAIKGIHQNGVIPVEQVHYYEGILCPGFVNVHCHLELAHMKGRIEEGRGLIPFLKSVMMERNAFSAEEKEAALLLALREMRENGIVAVGDIANGTDTLKHRPSAGMHIHTFVESIGFTEVKADERFGWSVKVYQHFAQQAEGHTGSAVLRQSIVPHAPYSVSTSLFSLINGFDQEALLSIHNEETQAENDFYRDRSGVMQEFYEALNIDDSFFLPSGKTSLQTFLPQLSPARPLILVHNTYMNADDIRCLEQTSRTIYLCLCPNANWYIERKLPPVDLFVQSGRSICLGTDSLSSNHELNIWSELLTIRKYFPHIPLEEMLVWATFNGAKALGIDDFAGSLEPGKSPGIIQILNGTTIKVLFPPFAQ